MEEERYQLLDSTRELTDNTPHAEYMHTDTKNLMNQIQEHSKMTSAMKFSSTYVNQ